MNRRIEHGLTRTFAATIGVTLTTMFLIAALLAYGMQVRRIAEACQDSLRLVGDILPLYPTPQFEPRAKVDVIMTHVEHAGLVVVLAEDRVRYEARWREAMPASTAGYIVTAEPRTGYPAAIEGHSLLDRLTLALASLAGYDGAWAQFGESEIGVLADLSTLRQIAIRTFAVFVVLTLGSLAFAYVLGRSMSRHALRPLDMVVEALERFAAGELSARPVENRRGDELGRLAVAYNGAIETVSSAFADRDRAEMKMRQFMADASHQLGTPLTVLKGFLGILRCDDAFASTEVQPILKSMDRQISTMVSLLAKLVILEQWDGSTAPEPAPLEIGEALENIVTPIARSRPDRSVSLQLEAQAFAAIDQDEFSYTVGNILTNALNYAPKGPIAVALRVNPETIEISIADEGPGLTNDEISHAFDRFYRGTRRGIPGSGLGLAIAQEAVQRAKGTLSVESARGQGSRFIIELPRLGAQRGPRVVAAC